MPAQGEIDFGFRIAGGLDEVGRYLWYADPRSGPTLERFRYTRTRNAWTFDAAADHVGYRDQRYAASMERPGKVKASFEWSQIPLWYGGVSASPFADAGPGVFRLSDSAQTAVQNGATVATAFSGLSTGFDTRSRRDIADAKLVYAATRNLDLIASFRSTSRTGSMPYSASFGFSNAIELAGTVDTRTNDITTAAEWSNRQGVVRVAYDGSLFANATDTLVWDNPLRITDQTHPSAYSAGNGSSQGRLPLWPDSSAHTVSGSGSVNLPARSRGTAYLSLGTWLQDAQLLPHTINTAIQPIPLPRTTAEGEARIVSMLYRFTSRPTPMVWLSAQYRLYDYDNRTPHFAVDQYVRLDGNVTTSVTGGSEPFDMTRHFLDVDASVTPAKFVALRAGYGRQSDERTYRVYETTVEQTLRASIDSTGFSWGSARLQYEHSKRRGEGLDEEVLSDIGEQVSLRQFDISDRTRDRVSAILQVNPTDMVGVSASFGIGREQRPDVAFGLQDNDLTSFTIGVDMTPRNDVNVGVSYGFENLATLQKSRQASPGPQFDDPTRDWTTDLNEDNHTWTVNADLPKVTTHTAVRFLYEFVHSNGQYLYGLAPNSTLAVPEQLPELTSDIHRASADVEYSFTDRVALGVGYRLDKWDVTDFGRSPDALSTTLIPAFVNILYQWRPYDIHTASVRIRYRW
jgi:MtrB/PioB family decaheme-associated outer membrane protein